MSKEKDKDELIAEELEEEALEQEEEGDELLDAQNRIRELEDEIKAMKDEDLRFRAETENYRKRLLKEKESSVKFANEALIKDLLDPIDNFSRAIESANSTEDFKALKDGISMVESQLLSILKNNWGLEAIEADGKQFDPETMEAYAAEEKDGIEVETVSQVFQNGYKLHGKVIRSAKVKVAKPKA